MRDPVLGIEQQHEKLLLVESLKRNKDAGEQVLGSVLGRAYNHLFSELTHKATGPLFLVRLANKPHLVVDE